MKKILLLMVWIFCLMGCDPCDDIAFIRLGTFSDAYRQDGWTDDNYAFYLDWFNQRFKTADKRAYEIIHNSEEAQSYINLGLLSSQILAKINFDKQVILAYVQDNEGTRLEACDGNVVNINDIHGEDSPACCKKNCPDSPGYSENTYVTMIALEREKAEKEMVFGSRCE